MITNGFNFIFESRIFIWVLCYKKKFNLGQVVKSIYVWMSEVKWYTITPQNVGPLLHSPKLKKNNFKS